MICLRGFLRGPRLLGSPLRQSSQASAVKLKIDTSVRWIILGRELYAQEGRIYKNLPWKNIPLMGPNLTSVDTHAGWFLLPLPDVLDTVWSLDMPADNALRKHGLELGKRPRSEGGGRLLL